MKAKIIGEQRGFKKSSNPRHTLGISPYPILDNMFDLRDSFYMDDYDGEEEKPLSKEEIIYLIKTHPRNLIEDAMKWFVVDLMYPEDYSIITYSYKEVAGQKVEYDGKIYTLPTL